MYLYICVWIFLFGYFSPSSANKCWAICHQGPRCTTVLPFLPCLQKELMHSNTQTHRKNSNVQMYKFADTKLSKQMQEIGKQANIVVWGETPGRGFALYKEAISSDPGVAGQDLLYYSPTTPIYLDKYFLQFRQIHFEIGTNTFCFCKDTFGGKYSNTIWCSIYR